MGSLFQWYMFDPVVLGVISVHFKVFSIPLNHNTGGTMQILPLPFLVLFPFL